MAQSFEVDDTWVVVAGTLSLRRVSESEYCSGLLGWDGMRERWEGTCVEHVRASFVDVCQADDSSGVVLNDSDFWCDEWVI
jgi:hypothetical protein